MPDPAEPALICPNCRQLMGSRLLQKHDHGAVQIDLCFQCAGLWFDHLESVQLAPLSVMDLFKTIQGRLHDRRQPLGSALACPRCRMNLVLSYDLGKGGRFSYFRCPRNDGRFTPFLQFLREKQFIRNLTEAEIRRVRNEVRQLNCSECGAPIDLEHDVQCRYCHAAVSFLDPEAVAKAMQMWSAADDRRRAESTPQAIEETLHGLPGGTRWSLGNLPTSPVGMAVDDRRGIDLIALGVRALGSLFERF